MGADPRARRRLRARPWRCRVPREQGLVKGREQCVERRSGSQWPRRRPGYVFRFLSMAAMTRLSCKGTGAWWMGGGDPRMRGMPVSVRGGGVEEMGMELGVVWLGWTNGCLAAVQGHRQEPPSSSPRSALCTLLHVPCKACCNLSCACPMQGLLQPLQRMTHARPAATSPALALCQVPRMDRRPSGASDSVGSVSRWRAAQILIHSAD